MQEDMKLPPMKTCADCVSCEKCCKMFGVKPGNTHCDFSPSRFRENWKKRYDELYASHMVLTRQLDEHPEGYDGPCECRLCLSYAAT